jgi:putative transposase
MLKAYKFLIKPAKEQSEMFEKHFGAARFVYNWGLEQKTKSYQEGKKTLTFLGLGPELVKLKKENIWMKEVNSQSLLASLKNLDNAYTRFFREKKGFPKFKSKYNPKQSFQCPQHCTVDFEKGLLNIPKVKNIKTVFHRQFEGDIKTVTISKVPSGKYYVSILVEDGKSLQIKPKLDRNDAIGIDMGLKDFVVTSDGDKIANPKYLRKSEERLARRQRKLSVKKKGSNNRNKQRKKVAKLHKKIANQRKDFLHKVSHQIVHKNHGTICVEDLCVKGMVKNRKLAKSISDAGWGMFYNFLKYKSEWHGKNFLDIGRFEPSSKMCSVCGNIKSDLTLSDREWICSKCETKHDRDINASINIRNMAFTNQNLVRCIGLEQPESTPVEKKALVRNNETIFCEAGSLTPCG